MKIKLATSLSITALALTALPSAHSAALIQFDFEDTGVPPVASTLATGITVTDFDAGVPVNNLLFGSLTVGGWSDSESYRTIGYPNTGSFYGKGGANSGRWGAFTITNNGATTYTLDSFTVDAVNTFGGEDTYNFYYETTVPGGGIFTQVAGTISSGGSSQGSEYVAGAWVQNTLSLTGMPSADNTFAPGETLTFYIANKVDNNTWAFDNIAINATAVPEPTAVLLGGLGMLTLLRRRRD